MAKLITEDDIEQAILNKLKTKEFDYDIIICDSDPNKREDLNDGTGRISKKDCILPDILKESLIKINPDITESIIDEKIKELTQDFSYSDLVDVNYNLYNKIRNSIKLTLIKETSKDFSLPVSFASVVFLSIDDIEPLSFM